LITRKDKIIAAAKADGLIQQLAGKYSKEDLNDAGEILKKQLGVERRDDVQMKRRCNVLRLIDRINAAIINAEELPFYVEHMYFNMNRTEDYNL